MAVTHTTTFRNAVADLIGDATDSGLLVFRITGSTANTPTTAVATLMLNATAFPAASVGVITAAAIDSDTNAAGGTIAFATIETSGSVVQAHCAVAASGSDIDLTNGLTVTAGDTVSCSALTYESMA